MAGGQGMFPDGFGSKLACTGATKELSSTLVRGRNVIAWLGSKFQLSAHNCVEPTLLRGWAQNCIPRVRNYVGFHAIA